MITAGYASSLRIVVLGFPGCPNIEPTIRSLTSVAASHQVDAAITCQFVSEADDLTKIGFRGSPTVLIEGVDIDPEVRASGECGYGCRLYATSGTPSREMISSAILRALAATD